MSLLEGITHKKEIEELLDEAEQEYDSALHKLESQKKMTTKSLEKLGEIKLQVWSTSMEKFADAFGHFKNIEMDKQIESKLQFAGADESPQQMMMNISQAKMTASEVVKAGFATIGTGALVGIASYGGAMMFASASTGTAIAALSGVAKTNATLAWFGGGSKAIGGLGILGGKLVLAGIIIAPMLLVAALITSAKSKEKLAEAKKIHAEAMRTVSQMETVTTGMIGIAKISDNYIAFIRKFEKKFAPFLSELERLKNAYPSVSGEKIDYATLTKTEQKTLHVAWLMTQLFYNILSVPILTDSGEVSQKANEMLSKSTRGLRQLKNDAYKMVGEDAAIGNLFWNASAKKMMLVNFAVMIVFIYWGVLNIIDNILLGIMYFMGAIIAFPVFVKFRDLPASRLYFWRIFRLVVAVVFVLAMSNLIR